MPRSRETDMADAIVCDTLAELGEVDVRLIEGVRRHEVRASNRRGYLVCIAPDGADPKRVRLVVTRFSPFGVAIERAGVLVAGAAAVAAGAYTAIVALGAPTFSGFVVVEAALLALTAYLSVYFLAKVARHLADRALGLPSEDEMLLGIAGELHATLTRSRKDKRSRRASHW